MTVDELINKLTELKDEGYGDLRVGYEDAEFGEFVEIDFASSNKHISDKRGETVILVF